MAAVSLILLIISIALAVWSAVRVIHTYFPEHPYAKFSDNSENRELFERFIQLNVKKETDL